MDASSEYKNLLHMIEDNKYNHHDIYSELRNQDRDYWKTGGVTAASCSFCVKVTCFNCFLDHVDFPWAPLYIGEQ